VCPQHPGSGTDQYGTIDVEKAGYRPASARPFLGHDYEGFDVELVRQ